MTRTPTGERSRAALAAGWAQALTGLSLLALAAGCGGGEIAPDAEAGTAAAAPAAAPISAAPTTTTGGSTGGTNGSGAGGQWAGAPNPNAIVIAPGGSDANACSAAAPCNTLERAQQAVRSSSTKIVYLRAGTYNRSGPLTLTSADNGQTWMTHPADPVNSAVLDCNFGCGGGFSGGVIRLEGSSGVTINGLRIRRFMNFGIAGFSASNTTVQNSDIGENQETGFHAAAIYFYNVVPNTRVRNNYVHDVMGQGIQIHDSWSGGAMGTGNIDGLVIENNVALRTALKTDDTGAIYMQQHGGSTQSRSIIRNNFVRDYGGPGVWGQTGIYLDQGANQVTITGNVVGPPTQGSVGTGNSGAHAMQNSTGFNVVVTGNIFDLGSSGRTFVNTYWYQLADGPQHPTTGNVFSGNIIISGFSGNQDTNFSGERAYSYYQHPGMPTVPAIRNNLYYNYARGQVRTDGNRAGDTSPITNTDPQIRGWTYDIASGSPVFGAPLNFPKIIGGWGPPGFSVPRDGTPPSSPL